ncbi:hypothetical protein J6590_031957 [Homalodisca vitripennis]|nr:hypothetical protein J6590_031957 [Homalodisca vitripennis]
MVDRNQDRIRKARALSQLTVLTEGYPSLYAARTSASKNSLPRRKYCPRRHIQSSVFSIEQYPTGVGKLQVTAAATEYGAHVYNTAKAGSS